MIAQNSYLDVAFKWSKLKRATLSKPDYLVTFFTSLQRYIDLTAEEETELAQYLKHRTYLKGQYIGQADDIGRYQTFIVSGLARTFYLDANGVEHVIAFGIENWWVGDLCSFASQTPADFNVHCLEKTEVLQISYDNLEHVYRIIPKMERFFRLIIQNAYIKSQQRIVRNHSLTARERFLLFSEEHPELIQRVPQYMIASYLGITKEFLSSIRNQIAKESKS